MPVSRAGALTMLVITVLWAATPAIACLIPLRPMTQAERECCKKMAQQCGSSVMPSNHSCCQGHERDGAVTPAPTFSPMRPFDVAVVPQISILLIARPSVALHVVALEASPPESSPGCSSILRI